MIVEYEILLKNYNAYEVGGKSKVLQLVDKFTHEEGYKLKNKLFFIDKDYEKHRLDSDVYMTPKYAVENFLRQPYSNRENTENTFWDK